MGHVSQWQILDRKNTSGTSYGGFIGYNWQWDQIVLGAELNVNRPTFTVATTGSLSRSVAPGDGLIYHTLIEGSASLRITDYGTIRGRAGYATGIFLPYAALGVAVARAQAARTKLSRLCRGGELNRRAVLRLDFHPG
jgi:opacity protein-like surface antigen